MPEVMEAIYLKDGLVRPIVALIKSLASALSIGERRFGWTRGADQPGRRGVRLNTRTS